MNTEIIEIFEKLVDSYDSTYTDKTDNVVDELLSTIKVFNESVLENMLELLKNITKTKKIESFYRELLNWKKRGGDLYMTIEDETDFNILHMLKNMIVNIIQIYPTILSKKSNIETTIDNKTIDIPDHWGLSLKHRNDVLKFVKSEYAPFNNIFCACTKLAGVITG